MPTTYVQRKLTTNVRYWIPFDGKYVAMVRKGMRSLAEKLSFSEYDCQDIEVATGEAVTNAVSHGQPDKDDARIYVHCHVTHDSLVVVVEDDGRTTCIPSPMLLPDEDDEHGRGWVIIHRLMDSVSARCTKRGLLVRMVKNRPAAKMVNQSHLTHRTAA